MKDFNKHIKEVALLGCARKPLDTNVLPPSILHLVNQNKRDSEEERVLDALTLHHFYRLAGQLPPSLSKATSPTPIEETQPFVSDGLLDILDKLLNYGHGNKYALLSLWLDKVLTNNEVIPATHIRRLLQFGEGSAIAVRRKIKSVTGNKGAWIIGFPDRFFSNYEFSTDVQNLSWTEGNYEERKLVLEDTIKTDLSAAIPLLQSTWNEDSIREKLAFLKLFRNHNAPEISNCLEGFYQEDFKYKAKEKVFQKKCRREIVEQLLADSNSRLHQQTLAALKKYASSEKKGFIFKKKSMGWSFPENEQDDFWNGKNMLSTYGWEAENVDIGLYRTTPHYWLACFVESLPFQAWAQVFEQDETQVLSFLLKHEDFQTKVRKKSVSYLLTALVKNATRYKNQALILKILPLIDYHEGIELLPFLSAENWEHYMLKAGRVALQSSSLNTFKKTDQAHWSLDFSKAWLKKLAELLNEKRYYGDYSLGESAGELMHPDMLPQIQQFHECKSTGLQLSDFWQRHVYPPLVDGLKFRIALQNT